MLQESRSQAQHAEFHIAKEREYEKVQQKLYEEFKQLDINHDGTITLDEIIEFLNKKVSHNPSHKFK
jgi:Ca2+-binding EF-hand superfamily protein